MIGKTFAHYEILEQIGQGGMGVVYRAHDAKLDRTVALKFLPHGKLTSNEERVRFIREAKTASALDHPNVGTIFDIQETDDGQTFIVMAHYPGESLRQRLSKGLLPIEVAVDMARQIAEGLSAAHAKNILHRDIKPDNVLVTDTGLLKVVDFGLAKDLEATALTLDTQTLGTAAYMSPEQAMGKPTDVRTDVWSLGAVLYEMLAGERPFHGDSVQALLYQVVNDPPRALEELRGDVPSDLLSIIQRALAKDPHERFSTIAEMRAALLASLDAEPSRLPRRNRVATIVMVVAVVAMLGWIGSQLLRHDSEDAVLRANLLTEARQMMGDGKDAEAFFLLKSAEQNIADDPALLDLFNECSTEVDVDSEPTGSAVYFKSYLDTAGAWMLLGTTPVQDQRLPSSYLRLQFVKDGYRTRETCQDPFDEAVWAELIRQEDAVDGMTYISSGEVQLGATDPVELPAYWMDTYEVTNRAYQEFVDAGGYRESRHWKHPFVLDGRTLPWGEAMTLFRDATGRAGPSNWELGHYPEDGADLPVEGVSWYEALAYLEFAGKQLPTVYHWRRASGYGIYGEILLLSNFESDGPAPAGSFLGLSPFGNYDMAGNVQEWCWNEVRGNRYSLGGSWSDSPYAFMETGSEAQRPFARVPTLGFRGMKTLDPFPIAALEKIENPVIDYSKEQPVGDELFAVYRESYAYDRTDLEVRVESTVDSEHWTKEKVSFTAAYGQERVPAYLFLPKDVDPPYQTIVYFPGGAVRTVDNSDHLMNMRYLDFIIRSGRALLYPIYQNTYERQLGISDPGPNRKRETIMQWSKDVQRSVDYLESRPDIDSENIAYYSLSLGSTYGPIFTAIEPRFRCSILLSGGLFPFNWTPDVTPLNFVPRSKVPTLMINGTYDFGLPVETSVKPMLALLGAPEEDKKLFLFDGDHIPRANEIVRVTLDWLDRYLGAPR